VIGRVDAPRGTVRFTANLGKREHLHCSAVGKAMLAALPEATVHEIVATAGLPGKTPKTITEAAALYAELDALDAQAWMTGADAAVFAEIEAKAEVFEVWPGEVKRK